jgi:PTS system nitrogen regulatory IIA component
VLLQDLIKPESVAARVEARSKKHCLELLADLLAKPEPSIPAEDVFAGLVERERLGCTSLARGVAFPHCRMAGLDSARGALLRLAVPVEFDALDGDLVDLVFGLVVPEALEAADYRTVDRITGLLADAAWLERLRSASDEGELYRALLTADDRPRRTRSASRG